MAQCKWCGKQGVFVKLDCFDLCKSCSNEMKASIDRNINLYTNYMMQLKKTDNPETQIHLYRKTIDLLNQNLLQFEEKGITTLEPSPSQLIAEFQEKHDELYSESMRDDLFDALASAENALTLYSEMYKIENIMRQIKSLRLNLNIEILPTIIALINQKGGVGKTTSTISLGAGIAKLNKRVLLIDFDPQANLTDGMGHKEESIDYSIYHLLKKEVTLDNVMIEYGENIAIIPSSIHLSRAEKEFAVKSSNIYLLKSALKNITGFDYILIDCPPSLGILTLNALAAANEIIVPLQPEYYALKGIRKLLDVYEFVKKRINTSLSIMGIIGTRYDKRKILHREVFEKIRGKLGESLFYTIVRENIALAEASSYGQTIFEYAPRSHGAADYFDICKLIVKANDRKEVRPVERM